MSKLSSTNYPNASDKETTISNIKNENSYVLALFYYTLLFHHTHVAKSRKLKASGLKLTAKKLRESIVDGR